jgi:signal peptidase I
MAEIRHQEGKTGTPRTQPEPARSAPPAKTKVGTAQPEMKDTFREIVETIVFVVVLVLLLKSFVAEAFVIPTGSMAETLYGYQKLVKCPECGESFPVNCSSEVDPLQEFQRANIIGCECPNCRLHIRFGDHNNLNPAPNTGDRVLVAKYLYDLGILGMTGPKRHDVVVFKYPENPQRMHIPMNYIKRLIGLPGETIIIHYGKVYVLDGLSYNDTDVKPEDLWKQGHMHQDDPEALKLFEEGKARILRKSTKAILAMRRLVYDNDHQAKDLKSKVPPRWASEDSAWSPNDPQEAKSFQHSAGGDQVHWLRYHHYIVDSDRQHAKRQLITDLMGYNTWVADRLPHSPPAENWVGDLILECDVKIDKPEGVLVLELSKGIDRFQAIWDLSTGDCTLHRVAETGIKETLASARTTLRSPGSYRLRFANIDERLTVWVDGSLPFGEGETYAPPRDMGPTEANDFEPASVGVRGASVSVSALKVWRDTYYTVNVGPTGSGSDAGVPVDFSNPQDFGSLRKLPAKSLYVQPGHFLCLGDNSPESSDGRSWGLVPKRLLLGRALAIYYPFYRIRRIE